MNRFLRRTRAIAHKEMLHLIRDPGAVYMALGVPLVMLALFGYGVSVDIDHIPIAVVDQDHTPASRRLLQELTAGGDFVRAADLPSPEAALPLLGRGDVRGVFVVPEGLARHRARGEPGALQFLLDGSDGSYASVALGDAAGVAAAASGASAALDLPIRVRFNPTLRSAIDIVPALIVMILSMVSTLLTALTVAREWERGAMEQLFATPVGRTEIIVGKLLPYVGLGFVQTLLITTLGAYLFDVPIRGSLLLLFSTSLLFLVCMLGVGLLVSVVTKNQMVSVQVAVIGSFLPAMLLSGFIFPIENMPALLQAIASVFPARYYVSVLRGTMLKGSGVSLLWPQILPLALFAFLVLAVAVTRFSRRLA